MKSGTQMALAVVAGYALGRRRKARLALMLGGAAATGGFGGLTRQLLKRGTHLAGSSNALGKISPELGEVTDMIRGDLVDVGKAAALTAVRDRIDRMSDRLHERADTLRHPAEDEAGEEEPRDEAEDEAGEEEAEDEAGEPEGYAEAGEDEELDEPEDDADYDEEAEPAEAGRAEDMDEAEDEDDMEREPAGSGRTARSSSGGSPIRRTRR